MRIRRVLAAGIGAAALLLGVAIPVASATEAPTTEGQVGTLGTDLTASVYYTGELRSRGYFRAVGEYLYACDKNWDGFAARAQLYWDGKVRATVWDPNGSKDGCGRVDLSLSEFKPVKLRVCMGLGRCSGWVAGRA